MSSCCFCSIALFLSVPSDFVLLVFTLLYHTEFAFYILSWHLDMRVAFNICMFTLKCSCFLLPALM